MMRRRFPGSKIDRIPLARERESYWELELPGLALRFGLNDDVCGSQESGGKDCWGTLGEESLVYIPDHARVDANDAIVDAQSKMGDENGRQAIREGGEGSSSR